MLARRTLVIASAVLAISSCSGATHGGIEIVPSSDAGSLTTARSQNGSRTLVRRADVNVKVGKLDHALKRTHDMVAGFGGEIERARVGDLDAYLTIRVPAAVLESATDSLAQLGEVTRRSISTDDHTQQAIDLEARIVSLRASRDRMRILLDRAQTVDQVITVERELARIQSELESLEGQQRHLRDQSAQATLALGLSQPPRLGPVGLVFAGAGWVVRSLFVLD